MAGVPGRVPWLRSRSSQRVTPSQEQTRLGFWKSPAARATTPQASLGTCEGSAGVTPHRPLSKPPLEPPSSAHPGPELPVTRDSGWDPRPRSSSPSATTTERPMMSETWGGESLGGSEPHRDPPQGWGQTPPSQRMGSDPPWLWDPPSWGQTLAWLWGLGSDPILAVGAALGGGDPLKVPPRTPPRPQFPPSAACPRFGTALGPRSRPRCSPGPRRAGRGKGEVRSPPAPQRTLPKPSRDSSIPSPKPLIAPQKPQKNLRPLPALHWPPNPPKIPQIPPKSLIVPQNPSKATPNPPETPPNPSLPHKTPPKPPQTL